MVPNYLLNGMMLQVNLHGDFRKETGVYPTIFYF